MKIFIAPFAALAVLSLAACASSHEMRTGPNDEAAGTGTMTTSGPPASPATNTELETGTKHGSPASE